MASACFSANVLLGQHLNMKHALAHDDLVYFEEFSIPTLVQHVLHPFPNCAAIFNLGHGTETGCLFGSVISIGVVLIIDLSMEFRCLRF